MPKMGSIWALDARIAPWRKAGAECPEQAWFWRSTPEMGNKWALNAQNGHQPGAERPELCARAFYMPNLVQGCKSLNTSGSVDPTGSTQDLWTPQDPHLPPLTSSHHSLSHNPINTLPQKPFTNHLKLSSPSPLHHSHPSTLPHKPTS